MQPLSSHIILVSANSFKNACTQVQDFFDHTLLVRYDKIAIRKSKSYPGKNQEFSEELAQSIAANRKTLNKFIDEFAKTGFQKVSDFKQVECGYPSKLLHIITHFLDGFIGIDTTFYNLIDDSHWLPEHTQEAINKNPDHFWLIHLDGYSETPEKVALVQT
jgi:hypothetical protein